MAELRNHRLPWRDELAIVDRVMKAISSITDPEKLVETYWDGIGEIIPVMEYCSLSRRHVQPPDFVITRSSRFTEHFNPFTQRDRLPKLSGGLLGELAYANRPVIIDDLPARLTRDDPGYFYLEGFQRLMALPQYDEGEGLNVSVLLLRADFEHDPTMIPILHWQAGLFGRGTTNLVLRNQLAAALATLDKELQVVGDIQRSLLPRELPAIDGFDLAASYQTSARAGGDYYDFFPLSDGSWGIFIADVSGHGTPAAVLMAITHAIAHSKPGSHTPPAKLLTYLNNQFANAYSYEGTFVTAFYAVLNPATRTLTYSTAGHNPPRLVRKGGVIALDKELALPLGIVENETYSEATIGLESGDLLLLYTDGITEAMAPHKESESAEQFGVERLDKLLIENGRSDPNQCIAKILATLVEFCGDYPPTDDRTVVAIRCR